MAVEERFGGFVGDGVGGFRAQYLAPEETTGLVPLQTGMLGLHGAGLTTMKSSDEHFRFKAALINHVWEIHV